MGQRIGLSGWTVVGGVLGGCLSAALMAAYLGWAHVPFRYVDQGMFFFPVGALIGTLAGAIVARKAGIWLWVSVPLGFIAGSFAAMLVYFTLRALQERFFPMG